MYRPLEIISFFSFGARPQLFQVCKYELKITFWNSGIRHELINNDDSQIFIGWFYVSIYKVGIDLHTQNIQVWYTWIFSGTYFKGPSLNRSTDLSVDCNVGTSRNAYFATSLKCAETSRNLTLRTIQDSHDTIQTNLRVCHKLQKEAG